MSRRGFGSIRTRSSGHYQARYVGPDCGRHAAPRTFTRKADAEAWLTKERRYWDDLEASGQLSDWKSPANRHRADLESLAAYAQVPTMAEYADRYMAETQLRAETVKSYNSLLRNHLLPTFAAIKVPDVTSAMVNGWWRTYGPNPPRQADKAYGLLHSILARAVYDELIKENPAHTRGAGKPSRKKDADTLTPAQVQDITDSMPERLAMAVSLAAWCGLRSGEVRELRRKDIDFTGSDSATIHITRSVTRGEQGAVVGEPKTKAGYRDVAVPPPLVPLLKSHINAWAQIGPDGRLFYQVTGKGGPMSDTHLAKVFRKATEAAETPIRKDGKPFTFHDLRAFALTQAGIAGATMRELQAMAGHTTVGVAARYQKIDNEHHDDVVRRIGQRMEGAR